MNLDTATVSPHDAAHCGKAESGSSRPCGEERIEDAVEIFFIDTAAII